MAYEHKEGKGSIFPNDYKMKDTDPSHRGSFTLDGKTMAISLWEGQTQAGVQKFSLSISEPRAKSDVPQRVVASKPAPKIEREDDIPF